VRIPPIWLLAPLTWTLAFVTWIGVGGLSLDRFTVLFWVITGLVAFTVGRQPWWRAPLDWSPAIAFFLVYDFTRGSATSLGFPTHWELPARVDSVLGLGEVPTVWLQERLAAPADAIPWWEMVISTVYMSFFVVPFILAAVFWLRSRTQFVRFMTRLMLVSGLAVVGYVMVPTAPPWAAARCTHAQVAEHPPDPPCMGDATPERRGDTVIRGLHPDDPEASRVVERISSRGFLAIPGMHLTKGFVQSGIDASNQVAAVPSLHAAEAALVCAFGWPFVRRRWRPVLVLYPLVMGFTLVFGGDHFVLDVLLGWAVVALVMVGARRFERRRTSQEFTPVTVSA
jgi:hypothetical protein